MLTPPWYDTIEGEIRASRTCYDTIHVDTFLINITSIDDAKAMRGFIDEVISNFEERETSGVKYVLSENQQ